MRILISGLTLFGLAVPALALTDKQEAVLNNLADAMVLDSACSTLRLNREFATIAGRVHGVDLDDPAMDAELQRRIAKAQKAEEGQPEELLCRAGLLFFGPEGDRVPNLLTTAGGPTEQAEQIEPGQPPEPSTSVGKSAAKAANAAKARSGIVLGFDLKQIRQILIDAGYDAAVENDKTGDYIRSRTNNLYIFIGTYDCLKDSTECGTIRIESAAFKPDPPVSFEDLNQWSYAVGVGWAVPMVLPDGSHVLLTQISATGGVTKEWLTTNVQIFGNALASYHKVLYP
jgi:hypothetical protein